MSQEYDCIDDEPRDRCKYCRGGWVSVDGGSLGYECPDCIVREDDE